MSIEISTGWQTPAVPAEVGMRVGVRSYGYGAQRSDCGRTGEIIRVNKTRVVVRFDDSHFGDGERTIGGECLRLI